MHDPELTPANFLDFSVERGGSAEREIYGEAMDSMRDELSRALLADQFHAQDIPSLFHDAVLRDLDELVPRGLREETRYSYMGDSLHKAYGLSIPEDVLHSFGTPWHGPLPSIMPEVFVADLIETVNTIRVDFSPLERMHNNYAHTSILELLQKVDCAELGTPNQPEMATDIVFNYVKDALFNPNHTLPASEVDALYLLCFIPHKVRRLVKGALVTNQIVAGTEERLPNDLTEVEMETLAAIKVALAADALTGQNWYEAATRYGASEQLGREMALISAGKLDALGAIRINTTQHDISRVIDAYNSSIVSLNAVINNINGSELCRFTLTDIGHGFHGFRNEEIESCLGQGWIVLRNYEAIRKSGQRAVVLEDDIAQREQWHRTINSWTMYNAIKEDMLCNASEVLKYTDDLNIGLFIIDIEDASGEPVGIGVAEELLNRRYELWRESGFSADFPKTKIVVWSASANRVNIASEYFKEYIMSVGGRINTSFIGSGRSQGSPLTFEVRHKLWNVYSDVPAGEEL